MLLAILGLSACGTGEAPASPGTPPPQAAVSEQEPAQQPSTQLESDGDGSTLKITFGDYELLATFEDNPSAEAFKELLSQGPVTVQMSDYGGFEKVGSLGESLPTSDRQTTTEEGDIVLYSGNQIVIFYGTNSWSYTRLGHVDDLDGWEEALGNEDVTVTFSLSE